MGLILWIAPIIAVILSRIVNNIKRLHAVSVCVSFVLLLTAGFATERVMIDGALTYKVFRRSVFFWTQSVSSCWTSFS